MRKNLRKIVITVTAQTAYHLKNMADACGHRDPGRVVDKLVREHQMATRININRKEREETAHVWK